VAGAIVVPLPLLTVHPGPTPDVSKLITIDGPTSPSKGSLHMTTVTVRPATFFMAMAAWANKDVDVVPREAVYTPGKSEREIIQENATEMDQSGIEGAIAAYRELGMLGPPEGVLILATRAGTPAAGVLKAADVLVALDGQPVTNTEELHAVVARHKIGDEVKVTFGREGRQEEGALRLIASPDDEKKRTPVIGVTVITKFKVPYEVKLDPGNIGGPSAGLMFSLSIVDRLKPEDLTHGFTIAGTGTIDAGGTVGAVGGVAQKVEAAERIRARYFLAPRDRGEAAQARKAVDTDMKVVEVGNIHDAVAALEKLK
jgi:PDZ domain-containing protein